MKSVVRLIKAPLRYINKIIVVSSLGTITHVKTSEALLALTFDDGPDPVFTPQLLNILKKYNARATFFMVGENAERHPELVRRIAEEGHTIGNHSWDHPSFPLIRGRERRAQIRACQRAISPFGKRLFRPPYGNQNLMSRLDALTLGYKVITWNLIAVDWLDHTGDMMAKRIIEKIQNGSIILFHDSLYHMVEEQYADRGRTLDAVELLLTTLGGGFRFVSLSELLRHGSPRKTNWIQKPNIDFLNTLKGQVEAPRLYSSK
jgi:peptidoglycan-N-acetylglucosamine deacetylase